MEEFISIHGAEEHNLKKVNVRLPRNKLIVITGVSGSGKSSLAFDTLYVEGQRRFMESLSSYARQFLTQADKPKVERIDGLGPTIAIEQRKGSMNPRSTVATVTEIYDYLRVLYARVGIPHCPSCKHPIERQTSSQVVDRLLAMTGVDRLILLAPLVQGRKGEHREIIESVRKEGFARIRIDGKEYDSEDPLPELDKKRKHSIAVVVERLKVGKIERSRLAAGVELALKLGKQSMILETDKGEEWINTNFSCVDCGFSFGEIEPRNFSFNSPFGACEACHGLGNEMEIDAALLIPNPDLSLDGGALNAAMKLTHFMWLEYPSKLEKEIRKHHIPRTTPFAKLNKAHREHLLYGSARSKLGSDFSGIAGELEEKFHSAESEKTKARIHHFMSEQSCRSCKGTRLKPELGAITLGGMNLPGFTHLTVREAFNFLNQLKLSSDELKISGEAIKEIKHRLSFMDRVGLHYLSLDRTSGTLSGGEAQRIRLASQIGSRLVGVVYVLDEPSIGLHQRDNQRLIQSLKELRDLGNTVVVVEHDEATIREADFVVDVGPLAGSGGGRIVASGTPAEVIASRESLTADYLCGRREISIPRVRRQGNGKKLILSGAKGNNLKDVTLEVPLGCMVAVTGVSGSGKSTLINHTLYPALMKKLHLSGLRVAPFDSLKGVEHIDKVIDIDQSPIGKTTRSNPATYVKVFDGIRNLFSSLPLAKSRGYKPGRFSFNVRGGRCEACEGQGVKIIEMHFMADVSIVCEVCKGRRYDPETLEVKYKGRGIDEVLDMSIDEALVLFDNIPDIMAGLGTLQDVGLGYVKLGQASTTLSGGESQRIKLAAELSKRSTGQTCYILDEPTTGLHFEDIRKLLEVLGRLVDQGNTVLVIEHNLDVIKTADHIIDLGPEGGDEGGRIIATGTPEKIAGAKGSHTGVFLKEILGAAQRR